MKNQAQIATKAKGSLLILSILFILLTSISCAMSPDNGNGMPEHSSQRITLERIMAGGAAYAGRTVTVEGSFRGWKGPCPTSVSITRSDWILDDGTGCIYVSGRLPSSLSASAPRGERVIVSGKVISVGDGKMSLQATAVRLLTGGLDNSR